jgi:hypothetical protein
MNEVSNTKTKFVNVRKAPTPNRYPTGHQGYHLPNDIEIEFEAGVITLSRTCAEALLLELRSLLR